MTVCPLRALAQDDHSHTADIATARTTTAEQNQQSALIKIVRDSTERFKDVTVAEERICAFSSVA